MATNNFKAFALDPNANVTSQVEWEALPVLLSGFSTGKASSAQINKAIRQATFIASAVAQFVSDALTQDIFDNGDSQAFVTLLKQAIVNGSVPAGIPMPWPTTTPPAGWLKCNGANFNTATFPLLAKAYPSGKLPDLRGEFIRGWDDGRGIDTDRSLGSAQASTGLRTAAVDYPGIDATTSGATVGTAFNQPDSVTKAQPGDAKNPDNGKLGAVLSDNSIQATQLQAGIPGGSVWITTRPRNVAFNYIVRAA